MHPSAISSLLAASLYFDREGSKQTARATRPDRYVHATRSDRGGWSFTTLLAVLLLGSAED